MSLASVDRDIAIQKAADALRRQIERQEHDRSWAAYHAERARKSGKHVPADNFVGTLSVNVNNPKLTDAEFRDIVRRTLPVVAY